jgi:hypothetical protein
MAKKKHQIILDYIYSVLDALDVSGKNTEKYKQHFDSLSEEEFEKEIREYLLDPKDHFSVELDPFDQNLTVEQIVEAAKVANVVLEDYLVMPSISDDPENPYVTNEKVMLGYINQRRVQQTLSVKNHLSVSMDKRNPKTGQVIDDDKNARISDMELYQLIFQGAFNSLAEYYGPRSDDQVMKNEMLFQIQRKGSVSLEELPSLAKNKTSLNYLNFLLLSAGYESDLINDKGLLPIAIDRGGKIYND